MSQPEAVEVATKSRRRRVFWAAVSLVAAGGFLYAGWSFLEANCQKQTVKTLEGLGAEVVADTPFGWLSRFASTPDQITRLETFIIQAHQYGFSTVTGLHLHRIKQVDAAIVHVPALSGLEHLRLSSSRFQDKHLAYLKDLSELQTLNLNNSHVTDEGLVFLKGFTDLRSLRLNATEITDAGLPELHGLAKLQELHLRNTDITDAGLTHLTRLKQLRDLDLRYSEVTQVGVEALRKDLPKAQIQF